MKISKAKGAGKMNYAINLVIRPVLGKAMKE
jgi:hypothetical protein